METRILVVTSLLLFLWDSDFTHLSRTPSTVVAFTLSLLHHSDPPTITPVSHRQAQALICRAPKSSRHILPISLKFDLRCGMPFFIFSFVLKKSPRINSQSARSFRDLGRRALRDVHRYPNAATFAEKAFRIALEMDPSAVEVILDLARACGLQDRRREEISLLREVLRKAGDDEIIAEARLRIGLAYDALGRKAQAWKQVAALREMDSSRAAMLEEILKV